MQPENVALSRPPIAVRSLLEEDAACLLSWLTDPRVLTYYEGRDQSFTLARIYEKFYRREANMWRCLITYADAPVGYIQFYLLDEQARREYQYEGTAAPVYGMDQFIGEPHMWGKGIGRGLIRLVLEHLTADRGARAVLLDPHAGNPRALRCYAACGFKRIKFLSAHELHEGSYRDCWLMEYRQ